MMQDADQLISQFISRKIYFEFELIHAHCDICLVLCHCLALNYSNCKLVITVSWLLLYQYKVKFNARYILGTPKVLEFSSLWVFPQRSCINRFPKVNESYFFLTLRKRCCFLFRQDKENYSICKSKTLETICCPSLKWKSLDYAKVIDLS